jgi:hypothetical protein
MALVACGGTNVVSPTPASNPVPVSTGAPLAVTTAFSGTPRTQSSPAVSGSANRCPFTGMPLNGADLAERRPLLIKLGNSPPERPQSGLAQADVVVEHLTEGAITRFSAIFYCSDAADIGPIRSARLIDLELVPMFGAIFAHVGGSEPVRQMIAQSEVGQADLDDYGRAPIFREIASRKRPFNRYTSTAELWTLARDKGWVDDAPVPAFSFAAEAPPGGRIAQSVTIPYRPNLSDAFFTYDSATRLYRRSTGTTPQLDAATNQILTTSNIVVLYAPHETTTIVEDSLGSRSIKIILTGTGKAVILRDGQAYTVTWTRSDPHALWQFTDAAGQTVPFQPGNTWIEVVPLEMQVKFQ